MVPGTSLFARAGSLSILIAVTTTGVMALRTVTAAEPSLPRSGVVTTEATITYMPSSDDYYPPASRSMRESGLVVVLGCYGDNGRMVTVYVKKTSRSSRLDNAALSLGKQVRVKPGTRNGRIASGCIDIPVEFQLPLTATQA